MGDAERTRGPRATRRVFALLAAGSLLLGGVTVQNLADPAPAQALNLDLPTWDDVQKAKSNEKTAAAKVKEIEGLVAQVSKEVERTRQESEQATANEAVANSQLQAANQRLETLEQQAEQSRQEADTAAEQASALISQMYRSGGVDRSIDMFLESDGDTADQLLDRLALMEKATERNSVISEEAERAKNNAESLSDQAESAKNERDRLYQQAAEEKAVAGQAAEAARVKLIDQEGQKQLLETQLAALKDKSTTTVEGYEERLRLEEQERQRIAEEARKAAEEEARRQEEERRRQEEQNNNNGGGDPVVTPPVNPPVTPPASGGWVRPLTGGYWVSTEFWGYWGHTGIDLATGQGTPIYAAAAGTVVGSGWYTNGAGYMVEIDHGGGVLTRYMHQMQPPLVGYGQWVAAGQLIGYVGTTGNSTGPHLHFETVVWGSPQNPRDFMAALGIYF